MCQKTGEISLLKQQLRDCQADISHKLNEIVSLRGSVKENTAKMEKLEKQNKDHEDKLNSRTIEVEVSLLMIQLQFIPQWRSNKDVSIKSPHSAQKTKALLLRKDTCYYVLHSTVSNVHSLTDIYNHSLNNGAYLTLHMIRPVISVTIVFLIAAFF